MTTTEHVRTVERPEWLPESVYPYRLRSIELGGGTVTFIDEGHGPTLLFVHSGMWSFVFRDVIARLRSDFRCVTLDFPGYGLSPEPPDSDLGLEAQAALLGEFTTELELSEITLVLHDLGGPIGVGLAAAHPDLIDGFVMANSFAWKPENKALLRMLRIVSSRPVTALDWTTRLVPRLSATKSGVGRHLDRNAKRAFLGPFRQRRRIGRFHSLMRDALRADDLYDRIEEALHGELADRPALTIFGEKNDPFGFQERHHETFSNHEGIVFADGNHFPMMDDPDRFARAVGDWWHRNHSDA